MIIQRKVIKYLLTALVLTSVLKADLPSDKLKHASAGFVIYSACMIFDTATDNEYLNPITCLVPVAIAAGVKEWYDYQHPENHTAEWGDVAATMAIPIVFSITIYRW